MQAAGTSNAALARTMGVGVGLVWKWRSGSSLPTPENVAAFCEALGDDNLRRTFEAARRKRCPVCRSRFMDFGRFLKKRYCGRRCANTATNRRARDSRGKDGVLAQSRLAIYVDVVERMCRSCEPEGLCHLASCELRGVSPLKLARRSAA
jgi:hypothetical protein